MGKAAFGVSVTSLQVSCRMGVGKVSCVVSVTRSSEVGVGKAFCGECKKEE